MMFRFIPLLLCLPTLASAQTDAGETLPRTGDLFSLSYLGQVALSLALVIALLVGALWVIRRMNGVGTAVGGQMRVVSSMGLGSASGRYWSTSVASIFCSVLHPGGSQHSMFLMKHPLPTMSRLRPRSFFEVWSNVMGKKGPHHEMVLPLAALFVLILPEAVMAQQATIPLVTTTPNANGGSDYALGIQILLVMTVLTLLPAMLITMTSFTRVLIVLAILRQAMGTAQTPSNQIILGLSLFLSLFIMAPVFDVAWATALKPFLDGAVDFEGALNAAKIPFREFMFTQTRDADLTMFAEMGGYGAFASQDDVPMFVLLPSFLVSELKTAFQIGFLLFVPFLVIDLVVAAILMAMGMMMLSPIIISLPFKLMLFVLIDGWSLVTSTLVRSFAG